VRGALRAPSAQYSCKTKLRADGQVEVHVSSGEGEESEAVKKEEDGSEDGSEHGFVTERKEPVPKWDVLAENKAVCCKQLRLRVGSLG
jgi:hypothetical protein